jgi:energy-coupling factor transport system substrate-specific component
MKAQRYYYTTRDLLLMAALAALGGISSTYINFIGDFFQSFLGFAGTTQWAAGLHVLWLVLAVGLTRKIGAGTITGFLKGGVELFSGNTHGLLIVLVDLVAGVLVDLGILPFRRKDHWTTYALAGGLASASNVLVFQLFAAVPADFLTFGLIGLIALVAFLSGVVFAGILGSGLLVTLRRSGVVKDQPVQPLGKRARLVLLATAIFLSGGLFGYLKFSLSGGDTVAITGAVQSPYEFFPDQTGIAERVVTSEVNGLSRSYKGYPLGDILAESEPDPNADLILLRASDGYVFFISIKELESNPGIVLQAQGKGDQQTFNVAGPESNKAWVNGVLEIQVIQSDPLLVDIQGERFPFIASEWVESMDSTTLDLGYGPAKYQGVPLGLLLDSLSPGLDDAREVLAESINGSQHRLTVHEIRKDDGIRVFLNLSQGRVIYALAHLDGEVYLTGLESITIQ